MLMSTNFQIFSNPIYGVESILLNASRSNEAHPNGKPNEVMMKYYLEQVNTPMKSRPFIKNRYAQTI